MKEKEENGSNTIRRSCGSVSKVAMSSETITNIGTFAWSVGKQVCFFVYQTSVEVKIIVSLNWYRGQMAFF